MGGINYPSGNDGWKKLLLIFFMLKKKKYILSTFQNIIPSVENKLLFLMIPKRRRMKLYCSKTTIHITKRNDFKQ